MTQPCMRCLADSGMHPQQHNLGPRSCWYGWQHTCEKDAPVKESTTTTAQRLAELEERLRALADSMDAKGPNVTGHWCASELRALLGEAAR